MEAFKSRLTSRRPQESEEKRKQAQNKTLATVGKLFAGSQPPKEEVNQDAEVFPTWSGHKKVVTTDISAPSAEDGLRRITVSSRVVQKDMWQEESRALERRALEGDTPRSAKKKRPVRKVPRGGPADAGKGAAGEDSPASGGEATGKGKAAMFANIHGARAAIKAAASSSSHPVDSGKTESPAAANNGPSKSELVDESPMDGETPGEQQGRQRSTYLDDVASLDPTLYDMNGLPYRNLNKGKGGISELSKSSRNLLQLSAAKAPSEYTGSLRNKSLRKLKASSAESEGGMRGGLGDSRAELPRLTDSNHSTVSTPMLEPGMAGWARKSREGGSASLEGKQGLTGSALAAHEKELGVPPLPPGPPSDDGSSLKSLEYHSEGISCTQQELAWQAQLTNAAAASTDPEITMAEIGRAPEHFADLALDEEKIQQIEDAMTRLRKTFGVMCLGYLVRFADPMPLQTSHRWYQAKSFLARRVQSTRRDRKKKEGWEPLTESHEFRLAPNGVLEVRKKGMWDETEEQRTKRLNSQIPMTKRIQNAIAAYMGWNRPEPMFRGIKKTASQRRREFTQECHIDFAIAVHLCEPLKGHSGTVKAIACVQDRVVVGSTDGKVQVWRPWSELYKNLQKQKSFRRTMTRLKSQKFGFDQSNMFAHDSTEEEGEEEEEQIAQDCEWSLFQVMDHGSAVTAMADVRLEIQEHNLNEPMLAVATRNGCLFLWSTANPQKWECAKEIRVASVILCMTFHEGRVIAGCDDGGVHAWRLSDMEHGIIEGHTAAVWSVASVDSFLLTGSSDGIIKIWLYDGRDDTYDHIVTVRSLTGGIWSIANGTEVVTAADDEMLHVIVKEEGNVGGEESQTWNLVKTFSHGHRGPVVAQTVVNVNWLVTCSPGRGPHVKAWNRKTWDCVWEVKDDVGPCWAMIHVKNSLMFGGAGDSICVYRGYVPEWLLAETERKQAEQYAKESAGPYDDPFDFVRDSYDPTASAMAVFGKPGGTSSRELAEPRRSQGSSLPPVEFCDSPPVTRTMMMS